jgi:hypothetical protein
VPAARRDDYHLVDPARSPRVTDRHALAPTVPRGGQQAPLALDGPAARGEEVGDEGRPLLAGERPEAAT